MRQWIKKAGLRGGSGIAILLQARDAESGKGMSDQQVCDEVLTLLLAGHETTANALSWIVYLLSPVRFGADTAVA